MVLIPNYIAPFKPLSNITPFTYRDGETYLTILERIREFINTGLIDFVNENFTALGDNFELEVNKLITDVNTALAAQDVSNTSAIEALELFVNDTVTLINQSLEAKEIEINNNVDATLAPIVADFNAAIAQLGDISGAISSNDIVIATLVDTNSGSVTSNYLEETYGGVSNVKSFGAVGDGVTDDTVAVQSGIDAINAQGGGTLFFPPGTYMLTQIVWKKGVYLQGAGVGGFGTIDTPKATRLQQITGQNVSLIIYSEPVATNGRYYAGPCGISHMEITASGAVSSFGFGIDLTDSSGNAHSVQDTFTIHNVTISRFPSGGIRFPQGAFPLHVKDINCLWNGGPGITYIRGALGSTQAVHFDNISGDGNVGSLIYIDDNNNVGAGEFLITNLKSERRDNSFYGGGGAQQNNAIHLYNVRNPVTVINCNHYSSSADNAVPGAVIKATSSSTVPPKIKWIGVLHVTISGQTGTALVLDDAVGNVQVPASVINGEYSQTREVRKISTGSSNDTFGIQTSIKPSVASNSIGVSGTTPVIFLNETDADVSEKFWSLLASGGNLSIRTHADDGSAGVLAIEIIRNGTTISEVKATGSFVGTTLEANTSSGSLILRSPGGTRYRVTVDNAGAISTTAI